MTINRCSIKARLLTILLLYGILIELTSAEEPSCKVPNPFSDLTKDIANDYYYFRAIQNVNGHRELVEEYFSLGQGLVYILHDEPSGVSRPWALLVDGREARSYIVHNADAFRERDINCELDYRHSHRHLFPWQYVYDIDEVTKQTKRGRKANKATIYGMGAVWLNLIQEDVHSTDVGHQSNDNGFHSWELEKKSLKVEMLFAETNGQLSGDHATALRSLDKTKPISLKIAADVRYKDSSVKRQVENIWIEKFAIGLKEKDEVRLQRFQIQLEICKKANKQHRQFPNLMRAFASSSERLYKILYLTKKYDSYGLGELDGKYDDKHHRFMWPHELTTEVFSLDRDIQTILYFPSFMTSQERDKNGFRQDLFMSRFTENASGRSARHATAHYHVIMDDKKTGTSCIKGEREPTPNYRLMSSLFTFSTAQGMQYEGHVHGLGALLLNAAHLHYKSFSLFDMEIQVPIFYTDLNQRRSARVDVWQVFDKHDKVRVLFYIEQREPTQELFSWYLSDRDLNDLARLVRVDLRKAPDDMGDEMSITIDQASIDDEKDLLAQYFIFDFEFELEDYEKSKYLEVPKECRQVTPSSDDQGSSDEDEGEDVIDETEDNYDKPYDESYDLGHDDSDKDDNQEADLAGEFQQLEGLETGDTPLPDFIEMLGDQTSYQFVTRVELLNDAGQAKKSIWLAETMDLAAERLSLKIYLTSIRLKWERPYQEFNMAYDDELVFRVTEDRRCFRIRDVDTSWLSLFSAHLHYLVKVLNKNPADSDLVIESNRLSTYGIGALWRRASMSGQSEYLGTRRERVERDGHRYRQLEWLYEEFDMSVRFSFLLEENQDGSHLVGARPQLESVLFLNNYDAEPMYHFSTIKVTVERAVAGIGMMVVVPPECRPLLEEAQQVKRLDYEMKPPTYEDVLGTSGTYEIRYTVQGAREDTQRGPGEWAVRESFDRKLKRAKIVINEHISKTKLEIYIDGELRRMFALSKPAGQCSIITSLEPTYSPVLSSLVFDNKEFEQNRMHGLLGLWQKLSEQHAKVHIIQLFPMLGADHERSVYRIEQVKPAEAGKPEVREEIKMLFDKRDIIDYTAIRLNKKEDISKRTRERFSFNRIEFRPLDSQTKLEQAEMDTTRIIIGKHMDRITDDWRLPEECEHLLGPAVDDSSTSDVPPGDRQHSETPPVGQSEFPKLSRVFGWSSRFHMRSEVSIKGLLDTLFLVDELYNEGDVRMRTRGIGKVAEKNCDLLMFKDTLDQLDLSTPLRCEKLDENGLNHCLHPSLRDVWLGGNMVRVDKLSHLHYGPLTLWKLAEGKSEAGKAKLIKTIDLASKPLAGESPEIYKQEFTRELNKEVWLISDQSSDWSYEMGFVKHRRQWVWANGSEGMNEWHVLESITANDIQDRSKFSVFIDVVNYIYKPENDDFGGMFQLPDGWNCRRNWPEDRATLPRLDLGQPSSGVQLDYEASLELFDVGKELVYEDDELGSLRLKIPERTAGHLPTLVETYWTSGDLPQDDVAPSDTNNGLRLDVTVQQSLTRFANGKVLSRRIITDRERDLEYEVDTMSGSCTSKADKISGWTLNFRTEDSKETHIVKLQSSSGSDHRRPSDWDLFVQLFLGSPDKLKHAPFSLINKYVTKNSENQKVLHTSYENEHDRVWLTDELSGPARIIRKYKQLVDSDGLQSIDFMTAQMYLLSPDKLKLRAILTIRLQVSPPASLNEFLSLSSLADCFNEVDPLAHRQLQSFTLEYPMLNLFSQDLGRSMAPKLLHDFYVNLLSLEYSSSLGQMFPLQLDGQAHLDFSQHDRLVRVHFDVMEAPTAVVYFNTKFHCTMTEEMAALAESRLLPNVAACSRWCDQVNCLAMSYCDDHLCQVVTERSLYGSSRKTLKNESSRKREPYRFVLDVCPRHEYCTYYYYKPGVRPPTLDRLRDHLDRIVNKRANEKQLKALSLPLDLQMRAFFFITNRVTPTRFYESKELFRWRHEDFDDPFAASSYEDDASGTFDKLQMASSSYALWKPMSCFDESKIDKLNEELGLKHDSKFITSWAVNFDDCLQECQRHQCLLVASCKNANHCEMITATGSKAIMSLGALKRELVKPESPDCAISIRDHLDEFHLFEESQKPDKFWHRLDDYTAPECAAACHLSKAECLAFDLCTFFDATSGQSPERSVCFLQHDHVSQDSFDRSVLLSSWEADRQAENRNKIDDRQVFCDHYSKSVVAEFRWVPNARLKDQHASVLRGVGVDKCAADCLQDDTCSAFEHCQNPRQHPTQSCYLIKAEGYEADWIDSLRDEQPSVVANVTESRRDKLDNHLVLSRSCSIYVAKSTLLRERVDHTLSLEVAVNSHFSIRPILLVCMYLLMAAIVGAVIQLAYIWTTGRTALSLRPS